LYTLDISEDINAAKSGGSPGRASGSAIRHAKELDEAATSLLNASVIAELSIARIRSPIATCGASPKSHAIATGSRYESTNVECAAIAEIPPLTAAADALAVKPSGVRAPTPQMHTSRPEFAYQEL
jgi:hypothetical protein